jgi:hypothetical protein
MIVSIILAGCFMGSVSSCNRISGQSAIEHNFIPLLKL